MLTNIKLTNFKSIQNIELEISRINLFIGANRTGKSSVFQSIAVLKQSEDNINWNGSLIPLGKFRRVLYNQAEKEQIIIDFRGIFWLPRIL